MVESKPKIGENSGYFVPIIPIEPAEEDLNSKTEAEMPGFDKVTREGYRCSVGSRLKRFPISCGLYWLVWSTLGLSSLPDQKADGFGYAGLGSLIASSGFGRSEVTCSWLDRF